MHAEPTKPRPVSAFRSWHNHMRADHPKLWHPIRITIVVITVWWILFCLVLLFVMVVYRMSAPRGKPRPPLLTGAVLSSAALVAASALFSWFIGMSSRYSLVYGSLASVIILLVWLYLCGNILILGNVFHCVWYRRKKIRYLKKLREQDAP